MRKSHTVSAMTSTTAPPHWTKNRVTGDVLFFDHRDRCFGEVRYRNGDWFASADWVGCSFDVESSRPFPSYEAAAAYLMRAASRVSELAL